MLVAAVEVVVAVCATAKEAKEARARTLNCMLTKDILNGNLMRDVNDNDSDQVERMTATATAVTENGEGKTIEAQTRWELINRPGRVGDRRLTRLVRPEPSGGDWKPPAEQRPVGRLPCGSIQLSSSELWGDGWRVARLATLGRATEVRHACISMQHVCLEMEQQRRRLHFD